MPDILRLGVGAISRMDLTHHTTIYQLLSARANAIPDAVSIAAPGRRGLTYSGLFDQVRYVVKSLNEFGIGRTDRVGLALPNGPEMAAAFLGTAAGAVAAPLNTACSERELEIYFPDLSLKAVLVESGADLAAITTARRHSIPVIELSQSGENIAGKFGLQGGKSADVLQAGLPEANDVALMLFTSGTTSRPKPVPLSHTNLLSSASNIAATLRLSEEDRCLNVMPLFHIHALVGVVLASIAGGSSVFCAPGFDPEEFFAWCKEFRPTWYTAVPTIHRAVLSCARVAPGPDPIRSLRFIRSSSSPLPRSVLYELEETFGVPVIEAYGMTEASHQVASNPLPPGTRKPGSVGLRSGAEVAIVDEEQRLPGSPKIGEIVIRGPGVMTGYANGGAADQAAFKEGWLKTGDLGYLDNEGFLFLTGRIKEMIDRGGEKVSPVEIDEAFKEHPAVVDAVSFPVPHPTLGEDIGLAVILNEDSRATEDELRLFARDRLAEFKIPARVLFVNEIPRSATGKPQRAALAETYGSHCRDFVAPRTEIERTLAKIWSEVLAVERVGTQDSFFELGGDSIRAMQMIARASADMDWEVPLSALFESPSLGGLAETIGRIGSEPRPPLEPLTQGATTGRVPLSFAQRSLWLFQQLEPENPVYNRPVAVRLAGPVEPRVLERCINEIVRRHEVLRARFFAADGGPMQAIFPPSSSPLEVIDLGNFAACEREAEALRQATDASGRAFDLAGESLVRARLFRLGERDHLLLFLTHHIVFDGWSEGLLLKEILALYRAFVRGDSPSVAPLPVQYADYTLWQQRRLDDADVAEDLSYWKQQLDGAPTALDLPADRRRPPIQTYRGARQRFTLTVLLSERLRDLGRREGCTLFMTLFAAFNVLLCRYTGQRDIVAGVPVAGRDRIETENLIGNFINLLALRTQIPRGASFRALLQRVREVALAAYSHRGLPFDRLVEGLPHRDLSRAPVFQVMFQLRNLAPRDVDLPGLKAQPISLDTGTAKFDLTLDIDDRKELSCVFEYNTDLFDATTVLRMQAHFRNLLEGIVADPEQPISDLPLLTHAERRRLLVEWNDTASDYPKDQCVHRLFEDQVQRTPQAVAVLFEDQELTYRDLDASANQLAHHLRGLGVGPEATVGICVNDSLNILVGVLGILKSGGAYLPLDPRSPRDRLAFMLEDARVSVLVTERHLVEKTSPCKARIVCLDSDREAIGRASRAPVRSGTGPDNAAYVMYTSGSTGLPKGVCVLHRGLVNKVLDASARYGVGPFDRRPQLARLSFDVAAAEIFSTLSSGAVLVLRRGAWFDSYEDFLGYVEQKRLTVVSLPTAYWHGWVAELSRSKAELPRTLRLVIVGTEQASAEHLALWRNLARHHVGWCNAYGLTEATITSTVYGPIGGAEWDNMPTVPIGRPVRNTQVYILDECLQPVPPGIPGELHIGGDGLARGYINRFDLTAEKFIPDPFSTEQGARLYKTGDVGRYRPDGNIEFLGRIDDQVKIRGFRVEPKEIEIALSGHPAVRQAVVVAREDTPGDKRLTAYVVPEQEQTLTAAELRSFLREKLPDYMVPSACVFLDALPLTDNGKIDRRSLPAPGVAGDGAASAPPRTAIEKALAGIWREVLNVANVGVQDDLFHLGGHSLSAAQVISRVNKLFNVALPLRVVFEGPTIERLAEAIQKEQAAAAEQPVLGAILVELESISEEEASRRLGAKERKGT